MKKRFSKKTALAKHGGVVYIYGFLSMKMQIQLGIRPISANNDIEGRLLKAKHLMLMLS